MRHLVTGGAGFLGAAVCAQLLADGDEPIALDLNTTNVLAHVVGEDVARRIALRGDVDPELDHHADRRCIWRLDIHRLVG